MDNSTAYAASALSAPDQRLKVYSVSYSLDRLTRGVDNIRHDVLLSAGLLKATQKIALRVIGRYAKAEEILPRDGSSTWVRERDEFKRLCREVLEAALNKAKLAREIQIDYLAQTAVVKMIVEELRTQYDAFLQQFRNMVRDYEVAYRQGEQKDTLWGRDSGSKDDLAALTRLRARLSDIRQNRASISRSVGSELCRYLAEVQESDLKEMREANFGMNAVASAALFSNPLLYTENPSDDFLMVEEYVLLGHRFEDPDRYDILLPLIKTLLGRLDVSFSAPFQEGAGGASGLGSEEAYDAQMDGILKEVDNIDALFNWFQSEEDYKSLRGQKAAKEVLQGLREQARRQKKHLDFFYKELDRIGVTKRMMASYAMRPVYREYCPPLPPQQALQYLIEPKVRKDIANKLRRLKRPDGKTFSLAALRKTVKYIDKTGPQERKEYFLRFLRAFARYHRDIQNYNTVREAMEFINLARDESVVKLSRTNNTLYEFLLPNEYALEEKPIINHVVLKADVRGSTGITHRMKQRGLNPASYFSLNFFDPVTEVLKEYGAVKVFIEGDAMILSIFEQEQTPQGWYAVARACGLAINILLIVRRYNEKSRKHGLPTLEIGTGIAFNNSPPTFLFDGDNRIMISSAINLSDRLSGCAKPLRRLFSENPPPFNVYVYQTVPDEQIEATPDDIYYRYNLNGIELNASAFKKLTREIRLKTLQCSIPELHKGLLKLHTGKFPTVTGKYQRLIIREARIEYVRADDLRLIQHTSRKYYEVCTHPKVYEYVRKKLKGS